MRCGSFYLGKGGLIANRGAEEKLEVDFLVQERSKALSSFVDGSGILSWVEIRKGSLRLLISFLLPTSGVPYYMLGP